MSTDFKREAAWHYLCSLKNIGIRSIEKLIILSGSPEEALKVDTETIKEAGIFSAAALNEWNDTAGRRRDNYAYYESSHKDRYRFISKDHPDYPDKLKNIDLAPYGLWVIGKLPAKEKRCAATEDARIVPRPPARPITASRSIPSPKRIISPWSASPPSTVA